MTRPDQRMLADSASPEQVRGSQISTISDIDSLRAEPAAVGFFGFAAIAGATGAEAG